jgi:predicted nucleotidyltransferase
VDVLVEFSETPSLLKFVNLENYLSDHLGVKVDLVHKAGLKPRIGDRILAEVVYL